MKPVIQNGTASCHFFINKKSKGKVFEFKETQQFYKAYPFHDYSSDIIFLTKSSANLFTSTFNLFLLVQNVHCN